MGSVLKIKDSQGNWIGVPALVGSGEVIIDIGHEIMSKAQILAYDKQGKPAQNIDDVYTGIFRFVEAESNDYVEQAMPCLLVQNKNVVKDKKTSTVEYRVWQMILMGNGTSQYREIENLSHYPIFEDPIIKPYDALDEFGTYNEPLSARQGYVLDQNKADKSEVIKVSKTLEDLRYWAEAEMVGVKSDLSRKESILNKVTAIDDDANNSSYPTTKAVKEYVDNTSSGGSIDDLFEYEYAPNLFDTNSVLVGKVILRGDLYDAANYNTTDYIPCKEGDTIRHQFDYRKVRYDNEEITAVRMARIEAYDDTKKYIVDSMKTDAKFYVVPEGASFVRISYLTTQWGVTATNNAIIICDRPTLFPYSEYGSLIDTSLKTELRPKEIVKAFLPKEICVAVGRTIELYNNQVCLNAEKYHMQWNCTIGKSLERKFSIEGTTSLIGEYPLTLSIVDDNLDVVWIGSTKIKVVAASTESFSICCIGDSLTNNKPWLAELKALNSNINLVGTKGVSDRKHEGRSGFSAHSYLNAANYTFENEGIHPFWNATAERFDWNYYVTNSLGGVSPDAVQIFLGTNKIALDATENVNGIKQMVDYIRQDDANIPIFIVNTLYRSNQNGIGGQTNTDGYNTAKGAFKYEEDVKVQNLMIGLHEALGNYTNVYFVPVAICHDSANNYGKVEVAVNPRATDKEYVPIESVHPQEQGYLQMADIMFSSLSAHMNMTENTSAE